MLSTLMDQVTVMSRGRKEAVPRMSCRIDYRLTRSHQHIANVIGPLLRAMVLWGIRPPDPPEMAEMAEMLKLRHFKLQGLSI